VLGARCSVLGRQRSVLGRQCSVLGAQSPYLIKLDRSCGGMRVWHHEAFRKRRVPGRTNVDARDPVFSNRNISAREREREKGGEGLYLPRLPSLCEAMCGDQSKKPEAERPVLSIPRGEVEKLTSWDFDNFTPTSHEMTSIFSISEMMERWPRRTRKKRSGARC